MDPKRAIHVGIGGAVERIEQERIAGVVAAMAVALVMLRGFHLLGNQAAYRVAIFEQAEEDLVGPVVEFLLLLAVDVGIAGISEAAGDRGARDFAGDKFARPMRCVRLPAPGRRPALKFFYECVSDPRVSAPDCPIFQSPAPPAPFIIKFASFACRPQSSTRTPAAPTSRRRTMGVLLEFQPTRLVWAV